MHYWLDRPTKLLGYLGIGGNSRSPAQFLDLPIKICYRYIKNLRIRG